MDTSHSERSSLKDFAKANILSMLITLDTSHLERSPLNDDALAKHKRQGQGRVIQGELASVSQLMFGANGGCTRRCDRARGGALVLINVLVSRWMYSWC